MAKYLKSIFNTAERKKQPKEEGETEDDKSDPPLDERRKLSISRSGRLKQANKKRHSLSLELYGDNDLTAQSCEKPKSVEYHVHNAVTAPPDLSSDRNHSRTSLDSQISRDNVDDKSATRTVSTSPDNIHRKIDPQSPDEEIDIAFEIIDKS